MDKNRGNSNDNLCHILYKLQLYWNKRRRRQRYSRHDFLVDPAFEWIFLAKRTCQHFAHMWFTSNGLSCSSSGLSISQIRYNMEVHFCYIAILCLAGSHLSYWRIRISRRLQLGFSWLVFWICALWCHPWFLLLRACWVLYNTFLWI